MSFQEEASLPLDPDGPLDKKALALLKRLEQLNLSLEAEHRVRATEGFSDLESDTLPTEGIQMATAPGTWLGAETNAYLKTDEAKAFKRLLLKGIEVLVEVSSQIFSQTRELEVHVLHTNPVGTLLVLSKTGKKRRVLKQTVISFADIWAASQGDTNAKS